MDTDITPTIINAFSKNYNSNRQNKVIENSIVENGLQKSCINHQIIKENPPVFSIELPDSKRYNQKDNSKCWIYSGLNFIKYNMADNLNIKPTQFELSNSFIAFFDKLEKSNNVYENIIQLDRTDWEHINTEEILKYCVNEGGHWQWFVAIVNKYGLVPYDQMPDSYESLQSEELTRLFTSKVKKDCIELLAAKNNHGPVELREIKKTFLQENYELLAKSLGEPKQFFDYEYKDKDEKIVIHNKITPLEFKQKFLTINLNEFISLGNLPMYNKEYYKVYREKYLGNVYGESYVDFLNLPVDELKELAIRQLKDGVPVYMGIDIKKFKSRERGILDKRLYDYQDSLGLDFLTKDESLNTQDIFPHHRMTLCGVNLTTEGKPNRWKVEDSYGSERGINGYYVMNDNYFDDFVIQIIINKKYLTERQSIALKQRAIEFDIRDPF